MSTKYIQFWKKLETCVCVCMKNSSHKILSIDLPEICGRSTLPENFIHLTKKWQVLLQPFLDSSLQLMGINSIEFNTSSLDLNNQSNRKEAVASQCYRYQANLVLNLVTSQHPFAVLLLIFPFFRWRAEFNTQSKVIPVTETEVSFFIQLFGVCQTILRII